MGVANSVRTLELGPTGSGSLDGLRFGVKDLIDIAGMVTGCDNPDWARTHPMLITNPKLLIIPGPRLSPPPPASAGCPRYPFP